MLLRAARCALVLACALAFAGGASVGADGLVAYQNRARLSDIADTTLRYVETSIDSAKRLLEDMPDATVAGCGDVALRAIRLRVYQYSGVKDLRVAGHEGTVRCAAYAETLGFDRSWPDRDGMIPVAGTGLRLFRVEQGASEALGLFADLNAETALAAVVGIDPAQFDVLPRDLRRHAEVALRLGDGKPVAHYAPLGWQAGDDALTINRTSRRYPIGMAITVEHETFRTWDALPALPVLAAGGSLGGLFGFLLGRLIGRREVPAADLDAAIAARAFRPFYQPIFSLADRSVTGCEILMRWVLPDGRIRPPSAFIPLAESTGRIAAMTWLVLDRALTELRPVLTGNPAFKVSVNIVPGHLLAADFPQSLRRVVAAAQASPSQVVLEITEREELADFARAQAVIAELRGHGFRVAVDDVGVGHSGLSYIQRLRPDTLKIDKFFVDSLGADGTAHAVVAMLVRLARELRMSVVAEGVETADQVAALRGCGVDLGQGYLVSPPVPLHAFLPLLGHGEPCARAA